MLYTYEYIDEGTVREDGGLPRDKGIAYIRFYFYMIAAALRCLRLHPPPPLTPVDSSRATSNGISRANW